MKAATGVFLSWALFVINAAKWRTCLVKHTASALKTTDESHTAASITWGVSHVITQCWRQHRRLSDQQKNAPWKTVEILYTQFFLFWQIITFLCHQSFVYHIGKGKRFLKKNLFCLARLKIQLMLLNVFFWHGLKCPFFRLVSSNFIIFTLVDSSRRIFNLLPFPHPPPACGFLYRFPLQHFVSKAAFSLTQASFF